MNIMNITFAQYKQDMDSKITCIQATIDDVEMYVPLDQSNRHYAEILRQVENGTLTIADAE